MEAVGRIGQVFCGHAGSPVNSRRTGTERQQSQGLPVFRRNRLIACSIMVSERLMDASAFPYCETRVRIHDDGEILWNFATELLEDWWMESRNRHVHGRSELQQVSSTCGAVAFFLIRHAGARVGQSVSSCSPVCSVPESEHATDPSARSSIQCNG